MEMQDQAGGIQTRGKQAMHELVLAAFAALEDAELTELFDALQGRLFGRSPQELMDVEFVDDAWEWRFSESSPISSTSRFIGPASGLPSSMKLSERVSLPS